MIFSETPVSGARLVTSEPVEDERGSFERIWCREEFGVQGIQAEVVQSSLSFTRLAGTVRGLHFAWPPSREAKLVRCVGGRVFDVILDLRPDSPTYLTHYTVVLDGGGRESLFVPRGVAHGFQTLDDASTILYMMSDAYRPALAAGVRFDDPGFGVEWPLEVSNILDRDRDYPDFDSREHARLYTRALEDS